MGRVARAVPAAQHRFRPCRRVRTRRRRCMRRGMCSPTACWSQGAVPRSNWRPGHAAGVRALPRPHVPRGAPTAVAAAAAAMCRSRASPRETWQPSTAAPRQTAVWQRPRGCRSRTPRNAATRRSGNLRQSSRKRRRSLQSLRKTAGSCSPVSGFYSCRSTAATARSRYSVRTASAHTCSRSLRASAQTSTERSWRCSFRSCRTVPRLESCAWRTLRSSGRHGSTRCEGAVLCEARSRGCRSAAPTSLAAQSHAPTCLFSPTIPSHMPTCLLFLHDFQPPTHLPAFPP
mmetsp:Transcript_29933/g.88627  ORF Transcript_29933/g.88627 Transcript_29933/m.88627 type:complete len:288 (+) Transcript_29933:808-1671(+)